MKRSVQQIYGFTLIELLVVVSIIALLVGLVLPALGAARRQARSLQCLTITRSIGQAVRMYLDDHEQRFAPTDHGGSGSSTPQWDVQLAGYLGFPGVLRAWRDTAPFHYLENNPTAVAYYREVLRCPEREDAERTYDFSYGQNAWFSLSAAETGGPVYWDEAWVPRPSQTVLHGEVDGQSNHIMAHFWKSGLARPGDGLALRHAGRFNAVFADGHAAVSSLSNTFEASQGLDRWDPGG
ncbi:MAG: prepilin-type N-terminal cleavage/methylation domain-containing protein [Planctomycetota bacterium]